VLFVEFGAAHGIFINMILYYARLIAI